MKNLFSGLAKASVKSKVIASVCIAAVAAGGVSAGVYFHQEPEVAEVSAEPEVVEDTDEISGEITVAEIAEKAQTSISSDSLEKDMNVYFLDAEGNKITGQSFSVKLLTKDQAAGLTEQVDAITAIATQISDLKTYVADNNLAAETTGTEGEATEETTDTADGADGASDEAAAQTEESAEGAETASTDPYSNWPEEQRTQLSDLLNQKSEAEAAYAAALVAVDADTYTDEDQDGYIYADKLDYGDRVLCFVPMDTYDPSSYLNDITIKEKVEHKVVQNIEQKTVSYAAAGDTQPAQNVVTEAVKQDTVAWVDSRKEENVSATPATITAPTASAGKTATAEVALSGDNEGTLTLSVPESVKLYSNNTGAGNTITITATASVSSVEQPTVAYTASSGDTSVSVTDKGNGVFLLTAGATVSDVTTSVTVNATYNGVTASKSCAVTVVGSGTALTDNSGNAVYTDSSLTTQLTTGSYTSGATYYTKTVETKYYGWQTIDGNRYYYDANGNYVTGKQTILGQDYTFGSDGALLTSGYGIDVSKWQGTIDWSQVSSTVSFAIIRAGFRGSSGGIAEDPKARTNISGANKNGIKVGLYFYSIAMTEAQAVEEASLAVEVAKSGKISLPIYIDMEDSRQLSLTTAERDAIVKAFCETVQSAGYRAGVYANKNWLTNYLTPSSYSGNISVWCAQYNTKCYYTGRYDIWQYSSKGSVPGISGNVDMNISYF